MSVNTWTKMYCHSKKKIQNYKIQLYYVYINKFSNKMMISVILDAQIYLTAFQIFFFKSKQPKIETRKKKGSEWLGVSRGIWTHNHSSSVFSSVLRRRLYLSGFREKPRYRRPLFWNGSRFIYWRGRCVSALPLAPAQPSTSCSHTRANWWAFTFYVYSTLSLTGILKNVISQCDDRLCCTEKCF